MAKKARPNKSVATKAWQEANDERDFHVFNEPKLKPGSPYLDHATMLSMHEPSPKSPHKLHLGSDLDAQFVRFAVDDPKLLYCGAAGDGTKAQQFLRPKFLNSPIFVFDDVASAAVANLSFKWFPLLSRLSSDIRLPFPAIIMQLDYKAIQKTLIQAGDLDPAVLPNLTFLLWNVGDSDCIRCLSVFGVYDDNRTKLSKLYLAPVIWEIDPEGINPIVHGVGLSKIIGDVARANMSRDVTFRTTETRDDRILLAWLLGQVMFASENDLAVTLRPEVLAMQQKLSVHEPPWGNLTKLINIVDSDRRQTALDVLGTYFGETVGEARLVLAALAMLNLRDRVSSWDAPARKPGRQHRAGKFAPYMAETNVRIILPEKKQAKAFARAASEVERHRRRHEVRGHWAQRGGDETCPHVWEQLDPNKHECISCERKRFFRKAHCRGDASLGWVRHNKYLVEAKG